MTQLETVPGIAARPDDETEIVASGSKQAECQVGFGIVQGERGVDPAKRTHEIRHRERRHNLRLRRGYIVEVG